MHQPGSNTDDTWTREPPFARSTVRSSTSEDFELLEAWSAGDRAAGGRLLERHSAAVSGFFAKRAGAHAGDLVQSTFLACVEGLPRFERTSTFRTYLFGIARNQLFAHLRRHRREAVLGVELSTLPDPGPSPLAPLRKREELRRLVAALRSLPLEQQVTLELHYLHGFRGPRVAAALEVPEGTIRSRIRRACGAVRAALGGEGRPAGCAEVPGSSRWEPHFAELFRVL